MAGDADTGDLLMAVYKSRGQPVQGESSSQLTPASPLYAGLVPNCVFEIPNFKLRRAGAEGGRDAEGRADGAVRWPGGAIPGVSELAKVLESNKPPPTGEASRVARCSRCRSTGRSTGHRPRCCNGASTAGRLYGAVAGQAQTGWRPGGGRGLSAAGVHRHPDHQHDVDQRGPGDGEHDVHHPRGQREAIVRSFPMALWVRSYPGFGAARPTRARNSRYLTLAWSSWAVTDVGTLRTRNEDAFVDNPARRALGRGGRRRGA